MKPTTLSLSFLTLAASVLTVSAQTAAKPATAAHAPVAHKTAVSAATPACVTIPPVSSKIPALPENAKCIKPLYTLTRKADIVMDYASPMMSPQTLEALSPKPLTITLLYTDIKVGAGELAKPGKWYTVNYTGYLPDGTTFDTSVGKDPISFPYGQHRVIAGWDTGFDGMRVGGKRRLYIPYQLAYGEQGHPPAIPAKSELIFDMELVSMGDSQPAPKPAPAPATPAAAPAPAPAASPAGAAAPPPASSTTPAAPATKAEPANPEAK